MESKSRKEVHLHSSVILLLQVGADRKGWSLKKYMENVLYKDAHKQIPYASDEVIEKIPTKK